MSYDENRISDLIDAGIHLSMTECYFTPKKDTTSATVCAKCGKEKMLHTIGEGLKVTSVIIFSDPKPQPHAKP